MKTSAKRFGLVVGP